MIKHTVFTTDFLLQVSNWLIVIIKDLHLIYKSELVNNRITLFVIDNEPLISKVVYVYSIFLIVIVKWHFLNIHYIHVFLKRYILRIT